MKSIGVELTIGQIAHAESIAIQRQEHNLAVGAKDRHGCREGLAVHRIGCYGEKAVSVALGIPWDGNLGDYGAKDVGSYQVRTAGGHRHSLLLHREDSPDDVFILVTTENRRDCVLRGWCYGREGQLERYWEDRANTGRPCFYVPQSILHSMDELP